jgi:hypothetical protein
VRSRRQIPAAIGVYVVVLISLQIFLLMVGLEAFLTHDTGLAWATAVTSVVLGGTAALLYRYLRGAAIR